MIFDRDNPMSATVLAHNASVTIQLDGGGTRNLVANFFQCNSCNRGFASRIEPNYCPMCGISFEKSNGMQIT